MSSAAIGPGFAHIFVITECPVCGHNSRGWFPGERCLNCERHGRPEALMEIVSAPTDRTLEAAG